MNVESPRLAPVDTTGAATRAARIPTREPQPGLSGAVADVRLDLLPAHPPAEVRAEVERAARRVDELRAQNRELHFHRDPNSTRIVIEVRDLEGNVVRTIPPSEALAVTSGKNFA